jgi:protease IV
MKKSTLLVLMILSLMIMGCSMPRFSLFPEEGPLKELTLEGTGDQKILVITIHGVISDRPEEGLLRSKPSMVQEIVAHLRQAEKDPQIKALLLKVNSPGGTVTASDILYHEISAYKEKSGVKMVAAMMDLAASGGYYVSLPADWIMAHPTTLTGSVGVIFARPNLAGLMEKIGAGVAVSKSGVYKDMGSPFRPITEEEEAIFQQLTNGLANRFLDLATLHRKLEQSQREQIATARVFLAPEARAVGLVDELGYLSDAIIKAKLLAGLPADARVVTYRRDSKANDNIYNPNPSGNQDPGRLSAALPMLAPLGFTFDPGFYYLWPEAFGR